MHIRAATLAVDSFTDVGPDLSLPGGRNRYFNEALGRDRFSYVSRASQNVAISASIGLNETSLRFDISSPPGAVGGNILGLRYHNPRRQNFLGFDSFQLDFLDLSGLGELVIRINDDGSQGLLPTNARIALDSAGTLTVPISQAAGFETRGETLQFDFVFLNVTPEFSFTLDEIRMVPEPSICVLASLALAGLYRRRRGGADQ